MRQSNLHIFVLIDALGWEVVQNREFLNDVLPYRRPLRTVLGFSSGAIPTILTGVPPAQNGHWNLFYYDPNNSPFRWLKPFRFLPDWALNNRYVCKLLKETGRRLLGLGPLFECCVDPSLLPWFNWVEKKNIYERGGICGAPSVFDYLTDNNIPFRTYSYHHASDEDILKEAEQDIAAERSGFFFLYLCELDMVLHNCFADPVKLEERLKWYDTGLRKIFRAAQQADPNATLTIFSDHGMTPVRNHFDLVSKVEALPFKMPDDYLAVYDSTMARFWFFNSAAREQVTLLLESQNCGRTLSEFELQELGIFFADQRYGELIFLLDPGWLFSRSNFNGKGWMPAGMHGYHPDDKYSDGVFLANQNPPVPVKGVADVYGCMKAKGETLLPELATARD
jgi:hypothetical protein